MNFANYIIYLLSRSRNSCFLHFC